VSQRALWASIAVAAGALALGYGLGGYGLPALLIAALGGLWLLGRWRARPWIAPAGLVCFTLVAATGMLMDLGAGWMLLGGAAALVAWDLDDLARRLEWAGRVEAQAAIESRHLGRLAVVAGLGLALAAIPVGLRLDLGFGLVLMLGLLAVLGLGRAVAYLRRQSD
jgi:hypothetical protein